MTQTLFEEHGEGFDLYAYDDGDIDILGDEEYVTLTASSAKALLVALEKAITAVNAHRVVEDLNEIDKILDEDAPPTSVLP